MTNLKNYLQKLIKHHELCIYTVSYLINDTKEVNKYVPTVSGVSCPYTIYPKEDYCG